MASWGQHGGEEDVRNQLCIRVSPAQTEASLPNPLFYTDTRPPRDKSREIIYVMFLQALFFYCISFSQGFSHTWAYRKEQEQWSHAFYQCPLQSGDNRHLLKMWHYRLLCSRDPGDPWPALYANNLRLAKTSRGSGSAAEASMQRGEMSLMSYPAVSPQHPLPQHTHYMPQKISCLSLKLSSKCCIHKCIVWVIGICFCCHCTQLLSPQHLSVSRIGIVVRFSQSP